MRGDKGLNGMCVLTSHRVVEDCRKDHDITWLSLHRLLEMLVTGSEVVVPLLAPSTASQIRSVALTFDDGTDDHGRVGEELAKRGISAIFFVPAGKVGLPGRLSARMIRDLRAWGHTIGSHGFTHTPLDRALSFADIRRELGDSKALLEDHTGARVDYFAPPGGSGSRTIGRRAEEFGYEASRSMKWGIYGSLRDRWNVPCVPVTEFTLARGWVKQVLAARQIPLAMRSAAVIKTLVPTSIRFSVRKKIHEALRVERWSAF